jgi:hypothetical protein
LLSSLKQYIKLKKIGSGNQCSSICQNFKQNKKKDLSICSMNPDVKVVPAAICTFQDALVKEQAVEVLQTELAPFQA